MNTKQSANIKKFAVLTVLIIALLSVFGVAAQEATANPTPTGEPIRIGVSGPLTGDLAQYGAHVRRDLFGQPVAAVIHRQRDAEDR